MKLLSRQLFSFGAAMLLAATLAIPAALAQDMGASDSMAPSDSATPSESGAPAESHSRIMLPEPLLVTLQATPSYGPAPLVVGFIVNAVDPSGETITSYAWNFGDGHVSSETPLLAYNTYSAAGTYLATVTVTTMDGRSATGFTGVIVKPATAGP